MYRQIFTRNFLFVCVLRIQNAKWGSVGGRLSCQGFQKYVLRSCAFSLQFFRNKLWQWEQMFELWCLQKYTFIGNRCFLLLFMWDSSCCYEVYHTINLFEMLQQQTLLFHINISKKWKWQWIRFRKWVSLFNLLSSSNTGIENILRTPFHRRWHSNGTLVNFCQLLLTKSCWKGFSQSVPKIWWHSSQNIGLDFLMSMKWV